MGRRSGLGAPAASAVTPRPRPVIGDTPLVESQIQYARSGDLYIAYEVIGQAPLDLLYVTTYDS